MTVYSSDPSSIDPRSNRLPTDEGEQREWQFAVGITVGTTGDCCLSRTGSFDHPSSIDRNRRAKPLSGEIIARPTEYATPSVKEGNFRVTTLTETERSEPTKLPSPLPHTMKVHVQRVDYSCRAAIETRSHRQASRRYVLPARPLLLLLLPLALFLSRLRNLRASK